MKKLFAILLALVIMLMCVSCGGKDDGLTKQERMLKESEEISEHYIKCLFNGDFSSIESMVCFDTLEFVSSDSISNDLKYEDGKIEIDGRSFDSVTEFIEEAEKLVGGISLVSYKKGETKSVTIDDIDPKYIDSDFTKAFIDKLDSEALQSMVSVEYYVSIQNGEEVLESSVRVLLVERDGETKVLSPTWISWILLGYSVV